MAVCDTAKVRFFKQITTIKLNEMKYSKLFVILQKYDFSSKSQPGLAKHLSSASCLWYCKSTIFQANHNRSVIILIFMVLFVILQKYDFSSKSQRFMPFHLPQVCCLWYCKSTIFQANHNASFRFIPVQVAVCDTAKVRFFKQITTKVWEWPIIDKLFVILQKYDFSSKSQLKPVVLLIQTCCLWYCKSTIFQANHNHTWAGQNNIWAVCDTAKVRFFKQITTVRGVVNEIPELFVILQKYDFSSKSQPASLFWI